MTQPVNRRRLRCGRCLAEVVTVGDEHLICPAHGAVDLKFVNVEDIPICVPRKVVQRGLFDD